MKIKQLLIFTSLVLSQQTTLACSAYKISQSNKVFVGKNFDWYSGDGYVIKNNRNTKKFSYQTYVGTPAQWISKYGSVTFNQYGKEFPYGGMNEKGLVVEQLWLKNTRYEASNETKTKLSELEWIQYQLDNFATVDEVITNINKLTIEPVYSKIHYFITDQNGKSVIVEYIAGELVVSPNSQAYQVITNSSKNSSDQYFKKMENRLVDIKRESRHTLKRFCLVKEQLDNQLGENQKVNHENIRSTLARVSEDKKNYKTQWTISYNLTDSTIEFKSYNNHTIKKIDFANLDFNKDSTITYNVINDDNVTGLLTQPYSAKANRKLLEASAQAAKLEFNFTQLNGHQMNPNMALKDNVFLDKYFDLELLFKIKKNKGNIKYYLSNSAEHFKKRTADKGGEFNVTGNEVSEMVYSIPKGEYALGSFHDVNGNGKLDFNFMKMPKEPFAYSNDTGGMFGSSPDFEKAKFRVDGNQQIIINIK